MLARIWRVPALAFGALMFAAAVIGALRWYSPVPIGDAWDGMLGFRLAQLAGEPGLWWAQHNEHRIALARALFWLDFELFGGRMVFLIVANFLLVAAAVLVFATVARWLPRPAGARPHARDAAWIWGGLLAGWLFQWMQFENFTRGFQSQFFMATLLPLAALAALARSGADDGRPWFAAACLLGLAALGSMANGVLALPLMLAMALLARQQRRRIAVLALLAAAGLAAYFMGYHSIPDHGSLVQALREQPLALLHYALVYLGGPFQTLLGDGGPGTRIALVMGIVFVLATLPPALRAWRRRDESALELALLGFIVYVAATALATAGGRLNFGVEQALSSRYTTPALMAWACLVLLHAGTLERYALRRPWRATALLALPCAAVLQTQIAALRSNDAVNFEMDIAALALALGVRDADQVRIIYPAIDHVLGLAEGARSRELSIFGRAPWQGLHRQLGQPAPALAGGSCLGHVDAVDRFAGETRYVRVSGWLYDKARRAAPRVSHFVAADGRNLGIALTGGPRPDVKNAIDRRAARSGFRGYLRADEPGRLARGLVLRDAQGHCELALQIRLPPYRIAPAALQGDALTRQITVDAGRLLPGGSWLGSDYQRSRLPGLRVLGSHGPQGDADTGAIEFKARRGDRLLFRSGPTGGRQLLVLPGTGLPALPLPVALDWAVLELDGAELPAGEFSVRLIDNGQGWGEWSAIGVLGDGR